MWWDGATSPAYAPLSSFDVAHSKTPRVASADNAARWSRALFRQIYFRKACARVDRHA
jgi:hypothetical protein